MFHPFPASRARLSVLMLSAVVTALLMLALAPGTARAACGSSTPASVSVTDTVPDAGGLSAPEIVRIDASIDGACQLTVDPKLQVSSLSANQAVAILLGFDPSTGDPNTETFDIEIDIEPGLPPVLYDAVGGASVIQQAGTAGFTASLDRLGVPGPTSLGIAVIASYYDGLNPAQFDYAPEQNLLMHRLPLRFTPPPPPPPPPLPPPPPPAPAVAKKAAGCKVPKLKRLTVKKAKAALKKAGCKYKIKGKGRVRSFSPKAGTTTDATVQVKCKKKKRKSRSRRSALRVVQYR